VAPKSELMRLVAVHGPGRGALAVHDKAGTMPGRGAYLCRGESPGAPASECYALAARRGGIGRTLRCAVTVELEGLESVSR
jgi:predicted RNA-binding protein YlxR (DUF448 family)